MILNADKQKFVDIIWKCDYIRQRKNTDMHYIDLRINLSFHLKKKIPSSPSLVQVDITGIRDPRIYAQIYSQACTRHVPSVITQGRQLVSYLYVENLQKYKICCILCMIIRRVRDSGSD